MFNGRADAEKGFSLIEVLIVVAIISILSAIAIQQLSQHRARAYDSDSKASLHNLYLACKAYWAEASSTLNCGLNEAMGTRYGFVQSTNVTITAPSSAETLFSATATHSSSGNVFSIDANGNIS
jgi:type IV pilus assembly protein PilA